MKWMPHAATVEAPTVVTEQNVHHTVVIDPATGLDAIAVGGAEGEKNERQNQSWTMLMLMPMV